MAQWYSEHQSAESKGIRFYSSWGLRIFLAPLLWQDKNTFIYKLYSFIDGLLHFHARWLYFKIMETFKVKNQSWPWITAYTCSQTNLRSRFNHITWISTESKVTWQIEQLIPSFSPAYDSVKPKQKIIKLHFFSHTWIIIQTE